MQAPEPASYRNVVVRHRLTMKVTVSSKGQIVIPAEFRDTDAVRTGQRFEFERVARGEYRLVRVESGPNEGLVNTLLECPEKDYFVPIPPESTDTL